MADASDAQVDYVVTLIERLQAQDYVSREIYDIVQEVIGRRTTEDMSKDEASKVITRLKEELGWT